ncbi:MAG: hypothetical protein LBU42_09835 [Prevotellaceae bacterium]|jgi:hypothetical protein|nr:hypothetical protein [Prevotellaceae bacterium]
MARPIKDTPIIIWGWDAKRLTKAMEKPAPLSQEKRKEMKKTVEWFNSIAKFLR